jgi:hypothetical protein
MKLRGKSKSSEPMRALLPFVCLVCFTVASRAADLPRLADAIRAAEGYRGAPGALGEEGPYQIRAITWRQHMPGKPLAMARQEAPARACALKHLAWLAASLEARGVPASAFNLAAAWNAGLERYLSGRAPERAYAYARRVEAIHGGAIGQNAPNSPAAAISQSSEFVSGSMKRAPLSSHPPRTAQNQVAPVQLESPKPKSHRCDFDGRPSP